MFTFLIELTHSTFHLEKVVGIRARGRVVIRGIGELGAHNKNVSRPFHLAGTGGNFTSY